jgi:hypothetical protein
MEVDSSPNQSYHICIRFLHEVLESPLQVYSLIV